MKRYETPMVEITKFDIEDVITTSGTPIDVTAVGTDTTAAKNDIIAGTTDGAANSTTYNGGIFSW